MLVRGKYILTSADPEEIFEGAFRVKDGIISENNPNETPKLWI